MHSTTLSLVLVTFLCLVASATSAHLGSRTSPVKPKLFDIDDELPAQVRFIPNKNVEKSEAKTKKDDEVGCAVTVEYAPVCGTDGVTYGNPSIAVCGGATVQHEGPCAGSGIEWPLPGMSETKSKRSKVMFKKSLCPSTDEYHPVCTSDGETYLNPSHARCSGVDILHEGFCAIVDQRMLAEPPNPIEETLSDRQLFIKLPFSHGSTIDHPPRAHSQVKISGEKSAEALTRESRRRRPHGSNRPHHTNRPHHRHCPQCPAGNCNLCPMIKASLVDRSYTAPGVMRKSDDKTKKALKHLLA